MSHDLPRFLPRLPALSRRLSAAPEPECPGRLEPPRIEIAIRDAPPEESARKALLHRARRLARQELWATLEEELRDADLALRRTPGGTPAARLLCEGAVADAVAQAAESVARGDAEGARAALLGFTGALGATTEAPWRALIAASAHLELARLWHSGAHYIEEPGPLAATRRAAAARDHMEAAHLILRPHDPQRLGSAALAAAHCAALGVLPHPETRIGPAWEALIAADPASPDHLRAYGRDLSPARFGTWPQLDRAARRIVLLTGETWRCGGYAWVWLDVLASQPEGFEHVEAEFLVEALHDLLAVRPDQHMANLLAAWCGVTLSGPARPGSARERIAECLGWIVTDHLHELHPRLWAAPGAGPASELLAHDSPDSPDLALLGAETAQAVLHGLFAHQLSRGRSVIFTTAGVALQPAGCGACTLAPCAALAYPRRNLRDEDPPCLT